MKKWLAVYSIADEAPRNDFGAAIWEIDENNVDIVEDHAIAFHSNKKKDELHRLLVSECIQPGDEVWILSLDRDFTGNGIALDDLRTFMSS
jgi:hypothetical protein